uniref:Tail tape measure protein n=1 Tax=Siphoviridae sp. ctoMP27 TaxID=2825667 RepID=A0A8S5UZG7_9CAUD|nr:MAG TPA: tail tape measure protein [Siphoviridae sp. ctoMP27]
MAKAYVQIVPSADGIRAALTDVFDEETDGLGANVGQSIGAQLVGTIKKVLAAAGIGKIIKDSIDMGGALQQSIGGIETLFGAGGKSMEEYAQSVGKSVDAVKDEYASLMQSQQTVFDNAAQAYKTVGLSANDYMEQTTSFAASLLSSVSKDTNAAAQLANMAMVDMADNANKMGTDMQDIQNAYQGFAKQNYTMLDNLKLGYGGTQAEMQRLLTDAEKISGVHYDLGNLADMYSAIHVIQQDMDITGTTAREAATTLTGSFASMSAAFQNVLGNWSTGADLTAPLQALTDTARTYLVGNLLPMIGNVLQGIPQVIYGLVPEVVQTGTELLGSLAQGFTQGIPDFLANALPQLLSFTENLRENAGEFVNAGLDMITQLANGLIAGLPDLIAYVPDIIINICGIINDNMPKLLAEGVSLVVQLGVGIVKAVPDLLANWKKILQAVLSVISAVNWLNIGKNILTGVANGVKSMGSSMLAAFKGGFSSALAWIKSLPSQAVQWGKNLIQSFINGLTGKGKVAGIATAATAGFTIANVASRDELADWTSANTDLADSAQTVADISIPAYTKSGNAAAAAGKAAGTAAKAAASVVNSYSDTVTEVLGKVTRTTQTVNEELSNGKKQQTQTITETSRQLVNGVLKDIKTVTSIAADGKTTVKQTMETVRDVVSTVTSTTDAVVNGIQTSTKTVTETLADGTEQHKQVITETFNEIVNGALMTAEKVTTIAADGSEQVAETIKKASADSFSGLVKGWQGEADKGVLGTFGTLYKAVKSQDWLSVGQWVISTLYNGLAPAAKQAVDDLGKSIIQQINGVLSQIVSDISGSIWDTGKQLLGGAGGSGSGFAGIAGDVSKNGSVIVDVLGSIGTAMGGVTTQVGSSIAGLASSMGGLGGIATSLGGVLTQVGSMILSNPVLAAILGLAVGAVGIGFALFSAFNKKNDTAVSHYQSPFDKTGMYDSLGTFSTREALQYRVTGQQSIVDRQTSILERIEGMLDEHLPDIGKGQVVMDSGELVGVLSPRMATNVDARIGVTVERKARGV